MVVIYTQRASVDTRGQPHRPKALLNWKRRHRREKSEKNNEQHARSLSEFSSLPPLSFAVVLKPLSSLLVNPSLPSLACTHARAPVRRHGHLTITVIAWRIISPSLNAHRQCDERQKRKATEKERSPSPSRNISSVIVIERANHHTHTYTQRDREQEEQRNTLVDPRLTSKSEMQRACKRASQ